MISPVLCTFTETDLFGKLADTGIGCYNCNIFVVDRVHANYNVHLALRSMLDIFDNCAQQYSIIFNAKSLNVY